ncbi:MAG: FumA C-terminus/TtdB family hydratase beta subunit [Alphaproteobacteria bacterium]
MGRTISGIFELGQDATKYEKLEIKGIETQNINGHQLITIKPNVLEKLTYKAFAQISHYLRSDHLKALAEISKDNKASLNDRYVAGELLENSVIAAKGILPLCQDTGTAIVYGLKGQNVFSGEDDAKFIEKGICEAYKKLNLRYSMNAPLSMYDEINTKNNLPAEIDLKIIKGDEYKFLFMAKGGGSANKTFLFQETRALLSKEKLLDFLYQKILTIGTSACPPYHIGIAIGGMTPELCLKTAKMASARYYDRLPKTGNAKGIAFRDLETEKSIVELANKTGYGAQFGGHKFCLDARVIRMPRHGASLPIAIAVSCSADRQIKAKINQDGVFIEKLETNPKKFFTIKNKPEITEDKKINLDKPMTEVLNQISKHNIGDLLYLSGTIIVARDIAHARFKAELDKTGDMPDYLRKHPVFYAGPAKTPEGCLCGAIGPTTAGRMDVYIDEFQKNGASMISIAKGLRSEQVAKACNKYGGFYLGAIGGAAASLATKIKEIKTIAYEELGMEAVFEVKVVDFPVFILVNNKGEDFYQNIIKK